MAEVPDEKDGYGEQVADQWTTTEKAQRLGRPRTLALPDLGYLLLGEKDRAVKAFDVGKTAATAAIPALALVGIDKLDPGTTTKWVAYAGVGAAIVALIAYGLKGELDLRAAAKSWSRLEEERRERWEYQKSWPCVAWLPGVLAAAYAAAGLWLGLGFFAWWVYAIPAVLAIALYFKMVSPMYRAWHQIDPDKCRTEWQRRGDEVAEAVQTAPSRAG